MARKIARRTIVIGGMTIEIVVTPIGNTPLREARAVRTLVTEIIEREIRMIDQELPDMGKRNHEVAIYHFPRSHTKH